MYVLVMTSNVYGSEEFKYDTYEEAQEGQARIETKVEELNDGIERDFRIEIRGVE